MEIGYRIPKLEEFVQGFEFEVASDYKFVYLDFDKEDQEDKTPYNRVWNKCKVYWKADPNSKITEETSDGYKITYSGNFNNFFKPFDEEGFIKQELVRVKV